MTTAPVLSVVTADVVAAEIEGDRQACLDAVRDGYLAHDAGDTVNPPSSFLRLPDRGRERIIALPAYLGGCFDVAGIKWIASYPGNVAAGIPRASAVLLLNDTGTGFPYACLEGSLISATRTAASAVLAAEALCGARRARRVGIVGTGLIATHVTDFLHDLGWEIGGYRCHDLDTDRAARFAERLRERGHEDVQVVDDVGGAFRDCDVVVLATVAATPHMHDTSVLQQRPVVLHLSLRDLAPAVVLAAQNITDDPAHAVRERTSLHLAELESGTRAFLGGTLADLLLGRVTRDPDRAVVFSPFGLGVLDLAVGKLVHDRAAAAGRIRTVPHFYPEVVPA